MNRFLDIDSAAWSGLEETSGSSLATRHVGPVCHYVHYTYVALALLIEGVSDV